jgi:ADP-ribosylglycohydrolase
VEATEAGEEVAEASDRVSSALRDLALYLDDTPLDLQDRCNGTGDRADEAFPFAVAMAAREPTLVEATLLSAVNVGGAAAAVGAMTGALLGAFNGWSAFPAEWRFGLEDAGRLLAEADALADALGLS